MRREAKFRSRRAGSGRGRLLASQVPTLTSTHELEEAILSREVCTINDRGPHHCYLPSEGGCKQTTSTWLTTLSQKSGTSAMASWRLAYRGLLRFRNALCTCRTCSTPEGWLFTQQRRDNRDGHVSGKWQREPMVTRTEAAREKKNQKAVYVALFSVSVREHRSLFSARLACVQQRVDAADKQGIQKKEVACRISSCTS